MEGSVVEKRSSRVKRVFCCADTQSKNFRDLYIYHKTSRSSNHMAYHWSVTVSRSIQAKEIVVVVKLWYILAKNADSKFSQLKVLLILYKN